MLALGDIMKNTFISLPITTESFIPTTLHLGDIENILKSQVFLSLK